MTTPSNSRQSEEPSSPSQPPSSMPNSDAAQLTNSAFEWLQSARDRFLSAMGLPLSPANDDDETEAEVTSVSAAGRLRSGSEMDVSDAKNLDRRYSPSKSSPSDLPRAHRTRWFDRIRRSIPILQSNPNIQSEQSSRSTEAISPATSPATYADPNVAEFENYIEDYMRSHASAFTYVEEHAHSADSLKRLTQHLNKFKDALDKGDLQTAERFINQNFNIVAHGDYAWLKELLRKHLRRARYLIKLKDTLGTGDLHNAEGFIDRNFNIIAQGDYAWLKELESIGYSRRDIAEVLIEELRDSPWIVFTPHDIITPPLSPTHHVADCAHESIPSANTSIEKSDTYVKPAEVPDSEILRKIEELCGLGGVAPTSVKFSSWNGSVAFSCQHSQSDVSFRIGAQPFHNTPVRLAQRALAVLKNFCKAAALAQSVGLCCNRFSVFVRPSWGNMSTSGPNRLWLRSIEFQLATQLIESMEKFMYELENSAYESECETCAKRILGDLCLDKDTSQANVLHACSLAAQFLCVGFLSYIRGHIGTIDPFFLDTAQEKITLYGNTDYGGRVVCELVQLTCLQNMIKQPVLSFCGALGFDIGTREEFDVNTTMADLLDIWGPGYIVCSRDNFTEISAIGIGGGYVSCNHGDASKFHWSNTLPLERVSFDFNGPLLVGGSPVSANQKCSMNEMEFRCRHSASLRQLGTHEGFWSPSERQHGIQGGQYITVSLNRTSKYTPGISLKARYCQSNDWLYLSSTLNNTWGLEVSLCTGVARRVSLRELFANLLPKFVAPSNDNLWKELEKKNIIEAFRHGELKSWLAELDDDQQKYLLALVLAILKFLKDTGIDDRDGRDGCLVIAWPYEGDLQRCLRIPCEKQTQWARILADTPECATFACTTTECLETETVKCQGARSWNDTSELLATSFSCVDSLRDNETYYLRQNNTLLLVKVSRPTPGDVPHLVVSNSILSNSLGKWEKRVMQKAREKHKLIIRERQSHLDSGEYVIVRAPLL